MALTTAPVFSDGTLPAAKLQQLSDAINERTPLVTITTRTTSSGTFTAETVADSVTASLVTGYLYRVRWVGQISSSVADGYSRMRIREDSISGTELQTRQMPTTIAASQSITAIMEAFYTAVANGSKTFVATCARQAGTGNLTAAASATAPVYLYVEFMGAA